MNQKTDKTRLSEESYSNVQNKISVSATSKKKSGVRGTRRKRQSSDIAVIGISGRFADSPNLEAFWSHLQAGESCIKPIRRKGWEHHSHLDPTDVHTSQVKWGGMLEHIDQFDPLFFNISPLEAARMDPQHRLFLEE